MIFNKKKNERMLPYDTYALASKLGHNSGTEKVVRSKIDIGLPFMVLYLVLIIKS